MRSIQASIRTGFHIPLALCIGLEQQEQGVLPVKGNIEERAVELAQYIIENRATVRSAAAKFGISKSTVHKDLAERLPHLNKALYLQVKSVLEENKAERHIRGGMATRRKYKGE
jgi:putative DeoR family transcriptional regulator (stage III sporulation protein D)